MPADHQHDPATVELLAEAVHLAYLATCARLGWPVKPENQVPYHQLSEASKDLDRASVAAVLDALTAAGWRPPPPQPDGIHWRVGTSIGRTIYDPHGHLFGLMDTSELAAAFVAAMNREVDRGRVIGYLVDGQRYHPGNVQIVMGDQDD